MLSKIIHHENYVNLQDIDGELLYNAVRKYFYDFKGKEINIYDGGVKGTLGVVFSIEIEGKSFFAKTHKPSVFHRNNLDKEYFLLKNIYDRELYLEKISIILLGEVYHVLIMDRLQVNNSTDSINDKIAYIESTLCEINKLNTVQKITSHSFFTPEFRFSFLYGKAISSLEYLHQHSLIKSSLCNKIHRVFDYYKTHSNWEQVLCHGDLSNPNIMVKDGLLFILDWEDAFPGSLKYDLSYWLTFMDQRKYYQHEIVKDLIKNDDEIFFYMIMVLVLKGYLSILDGSIFQHKITIHERIEEILELR